MFLYSKQAQYSYLILLTVWFIISLHVAYRYVSFSSEQTNAKGGTFVEATIEDINYLPYVTNNDTDKFYQSFLFNGCVYPSFSGITINYREELCTIRTTDYKNFFISAVDGKYRSDGQPFTLNDIYFTYMTLLKENYRSIGALDSYKNISIVANEEEETLQIIFPKASVDNMIFFTNFILPAHLLANQSLESYISTFYTNPVGTNCGRLASNQNDPDSVVFDLSTCADIPLKFYQIKQFTDQVALQSYIYGSNNTIDLIISPETYEGFNANQVLLNKFISIFFNTQREQFTPSLRQQLATFITNHIYNETAITNILIQDHYLFDAFVSHEVTTLRETLININTIDEVAKEITNIPELPQILRRQADATDAKEYLLQTPIEDKKELKFVFDTNYDKISVSFNDGVEYFPESYDTINKTSYYNLNPTYRNIIEGRNTYTIKAYNENNIHTDTYSFIVYYLSDPTFEEDEYTANILGSTIDTLDIIYFASPANTIVAKSLEQLFTRYEINDYFNFTAFDDADMFAGKIQSTDYDIVLSSINMGLRKDISNLFITENPNINPSLYTDEDLAGATNEYFLFDTAAQPAIKERINTLYQEHTPFIILGKELGTIHIEESLAFPYPLRMYVLGWRKDFIKDLPGFQHVDINRDRVWSRKNFNQFLTTGL